MKQLLTLAMIGMALLFTASARAEKPKSSPEEEALHKRAEAFVEAFNKGDAKAVAGFWTPEGDLVDQEGHKFKGRKAIEELYTKVFGETKGAKLFIRIGSVRVARPDLALEDGETEVVFPDGPPSAGRYSVV